MSEARNRPLHGYGRPEHRANEASYFAMRRAGSSPNCAAERLNLTQTAAENFESWWRSSLAHPSTEIQTDDSGYIAACNAAGGFPGVSPYSYGKPWRGRT